MMPSEWYAELCRLVGSAIGLWHQQRAIPAVVVIIGKDQNGVIRSTMCSQSVESPPSAAWVALELRKAADSLEAAK